jgi:hypothetical protein
MNAKLNKRERRAAQLLAHYATFERLARHLGMEKPDGEKISVALFKLEKLAHDGATAYCNGEYFLPNSRLRHSPYAFSRTEGAWDTFGKDVADELEKLLGKLPPGFFVNGDPRGYALKIDNECAEGKALIAACKLHTDWGGYGILSPEITENN